MDIQVLFVHKKDSSESFSVTIDQLKDKEFQSYRGLAYGAPGNTPKHYVDYSDLSCVVPFLRMPTREELCMSPDASSPNRSARIQDGTANDNSVDSAVFADMPDSQIDLYSPPPNDEIYSCNMFESEWVDSSGSSITCAQKPRKALEFDTQCSSGIGSAGDEEQFEESATEDETIDENENWEMDFDDDLCECGSECETTDPPRCNDSLFNGI